MTRVTLSDESVALAVLHGQVQRETEILLALRAEQRRLASRILESQRHLAACTDAMQQILARTPKPLL